MLTGAAKARGDRAATVAVVDRRIVRLDGVEPILDAGGGISWCFADEICDSFSGSRCEQVFNHLFHGPSIVTGHLLSRAGSDSNIAQLMLTSRLDLRIGRELHFAKLEEKLGRRFSRRYSTALPLH